MTGLIPARVCDGQSMPSLAMQDVFDLLRKQQQAAAGRPPPTLAGRRATFTPGGRPHPVPDDVRVSAVSAGGVPAHWLNAPGVDPGRVLVFLHGGGFEFGSVASDGELAARLGRAAACGCCFRSTGWRPSTGSRPPWMMSGRCGTGCVPTRA